MFSSQFPISLLAALTEAGTNKGQSIMASVIYAALSNSADGAYREKFLSLLSARES